MTIPLPSGAAARPDTAHRPAPHTILNVGQNFHVRGGSDSYLLALGELLEAEGHRVIPFAARSERNAPSPWAEYFPIGADLEHPRAVDLVRYLYSPAAARALDRLLSAVPIDLAHLHIYYGKLTSAILAPLKKRGIPVVQTLHEYKLICPVYTLVSNGRICEACQGHQFWRALPRRCNRDSFARTALSVMEASVSRLGGAWERVDHFIAVSEFQRGKMIQFGLEPARISTVPNFIDARQYAVADTPGEYALYLGRLERIKGLETLLAAAIRQPTLPLVIVGDGPLRGMLEQRLREPALGHVRLAGFLTGAALREAVRGSRCVVLPSEWYETFGLVLLEAFAAGRPVIASRIGGIPEVVREGDDGLLFPPGSVDDLAQALGWMQDHGADAAEMGRRGRRKVEEVFAPGLHYQRLLAIYRGLT